MILPFNVPKRLLTRIEKHEKQEKWVQDVIAKSHQLIIEHYRNQEGIVKGGAQIS